MTSVWDAEVVKLLRGVDLKAYADDARGKEAHLEDILKALETRDDIWGALMNYPRTVIVGPDEGFAPKWSNAAFVGHWPLEWNPGMTAKAKPRMKNLRDVDQIIWLSHYKLPKTGTWRAFSGPVIEIGLIRMNHEKRTDETFAPTFGAVRLTSKGDEQPGATKSFKSGVGDPYKAKEAATIMNYVFGANIRPTESPESFFISTNKEMEAQEHDFYLRKCAVVLEYAMRNRTSSISDILQTNISGHVGITLMHRAISAGQVPYAQVDLDKDNGQPPVMPGETTIDEIVDVLDQVVGYGGDESSISTRARIGKPFEPSYVRRATANPYDALSEFDSDGDYDVNQDDVDGFRMEGALSPFSCSEDEFGD